MNEQLQIEAMARVDGMTNLIEDCNGGGIRGNLGEDGDVSACYTTSHDAVQRVVDGMSRNECREYVDQLIIMLVDFELIHKATPLQKCEAILRALGKWTKESE